MGDAGKGREEPPPAAVDLKEPSRAKEENPVEAADSISGILPEGQVDP